MEIVDFNGGYTIDGPKVLSPSIFDDERGYFFESYNKELFDKLIGYEVNFVQDNESKSSYGVTRGLHFQNPPYAQAKLVRVVKGSVFDVAVDIRKDSPTYGQWCGAYLSEDNHRQFFIPKGFAHGFIALQDDTVFQYKCDNVYNKESEGSINFFDKDIAIGWEHWVNWNRMVFSPKDLKAPMLRDIDSKFVYEEKNINNKTKVETNDLKCTKK